MSALREARNLKYEIEHTLARSLQDFTDEHGLVVQNGDIGRIENTQLGDEHPKYRYHVDLDIRVG